MDFTQVLPIAQEMIQAFPAEQRAEFEGMVTAFAVAAAPIFQSIGPEIYTVTSYDEPLAADSMRQLIAIKVSNEPAVIAALNQYAQGLGARVRDFLGHQIWETPAMLGQQFAVGVGAGWAFYGLPVDVENAFRQLQADDPQTIADNPSFDTATDRLRRGGLGYQWADTGAWLEFAKWQAENVEEVVRAQFAGGGFGGPGWQPDEEFMDFMIEQARNQPLNVLLRDAPPVDVLIGAIGDQIADYRWEDGAMVGRWIMLRPVR
jgi:hypothetical protein